ncbi:16S rRNA (cytosine(1402)-N(4))-methyltransferase RsmH [Desulfobotulus sp.]|jgi:16S rRNA (cytosine1402-N4)-methyltransferase|uniref:16S rRNA (cytosine(1402)-N(4))-methyltransferase RsmH n=1 Tax=Desulfobotulus sp. TaxID=1940337 RepID=UPI002A359E14|nr:16S rRNA (cytosine(1402)-N(4))-methyltransferase RsmH [Desulfobotulus sp.]MDY0164016.1 16S rRNA (cytosine(1402)-N(4))-methyltransferase RsmH [Desulfobotulus sp.]
MNFHHVSCMPTEVLAFLLGEPGGIYVDATLGGSGHTRRILEATDSRTRVIGIDQDPDAIAWGRKVLASFGDRACIVRGNFADVPAILDRLGIDAVDGILADLGLSCHQLEASGRGFSFKGDEPLDMRMDPESEICAADLVNTESEEALKKIFRDFGEERFAGPIARRILSARAQAPIQTTGELTEIIRRVIPAKHSAKQKIHPATRVFMALRIAVNQEMAQLDRFLEDAPLRLRPKGRMVVLSFHSLEDRRVKQRFRDLATSCVCPPEFPICTCGRKAGFRVLTSKAIRPGEEEIAVNPMARSTRLRAMQRLP